MKDTFYFQHDYNAANDIRVVKLRAKFNNAEGYGIYFMILESMAQTNNGFLDQDPSDHLALTYNVEKKKIADIIDFCIKIGLFKKDKRGIYSRRMLEHKEFRQERAKAGRNGSAIRWGNSSANSSAIGSAYAKERKGKERKENKDFDHFSSEKPRKNTQAKTYLENLQQ